MTLVCAPRGPTLLFAASTSWLSRAIRRLTGSDASHAAIGAELLGLPVVVHASVGGVKVEARAAFERGREVVAEYAMPPLGDRLLAGAVAQLGERYDYVGLVGYLPVLAARRLGRRIANPFASSHALVCSEFVLRLDPGGEVIPEWGSLDPERATPGDLLDVCRARPDLFSRIDPGRARG